MANTYLKSKHLFHFVVLSYFIIRFRRNNDPDPNIPFIFKTTFFTIVVIWGYFQLMLMSVEVSLKISQKYSKIVSSEDFMYLLYVIREKKWPAWQYYWQCGSVHKLCCLKICNFRLPPPPCRLLYSIYKDRLWGYPRPLPPCRDDIVYGRSLCLCRGFIFVHWWIQLSSENWKHFQKDFPSAVR